MDPVKHKKKQAAEAEASLQALAELDELFHHPCWPRWMRFLEERKAAALVALAQQKEEKWSEFGRKQGEVTILTELLSFPGKIARDVESHRTRLDSLTRSIREHE